MEQEYLINGNNALQLDFAVMPELRVIDSRKKFYNINKNGLGEVAGAFLEEGVDDDPRKRINISELYPESRIELDRWEYNEHSAAEREATVNVFNLGKNGHNLVIWISPEDGKTYKEGRLNILFPVFGDNGWSMYGRHVPLVCNGPESLELANRLLENSGVSIESIDDLESLRQQPIGFKIEKTDDWIKICKDLMPEFMEIWNFIEDGNDVKNKNRMERDVLSAMEIADGDNRLFESIMARMGNRINAEGGHGSSWNSSNNGMGVIVSVNSNGELSYKLGNTEGLKLCQHCGCYYEGNKCPVCNK
jgi:hypothetical protein